MINNIQIKAILCLNGNLPKKEFFQSLNGFNSLPIIAADGAANKLIKLGINPQIIIGDLDSLSSENFAKDIIFEYKNQDYTDFEKSIFILKNRGLYPILVCGMFGGEIDHAINNLNCFMKYQQEVSMIFYDEDKNQHPKYGVSLEREQIFITKPNEIISIIPHPSAIISSQGLKWELSNTKLSIDGLSSIRNQALADKITITLHQGSALLINTNSHF